MKQLVWNVHMEKGAFMHGKGFIKFEVALFEKCSSKK
jgi:hypothetical protein